MATIILFTLFGILLTGVAAVMGVGFLTICCGVLQVLQSMIAAPTPSPALAH